MTPLSVRPPHRLGRAVVFAALIGPWLLPFSAAECGEPWAAAELSYGTDSNPMELPSGGRQGTFTETALEAGYRPSRGGRLGLLAEARGVRRWHSSGLGGADTGWGEARAGLAAVPFARGSRKVALLAGASWGLFRMTLIDPDTGEIYRQASGPGTTVAISDRLDFDSRGAFMDVRWQAGRSLLVYLESEWLRREYVTDYRRAAGLPSLDDTTVTVEPGVRARMAPGVIVDLSWARSRRDYDELPSLDEDAAEVDGERRAYVASRWQAALRLDPGPRWEIVAAYRAAERSDLYAGYYDTEASGAVLSARFSPAEGTALKAVVSGRTLDYLNASVNNDPSEPARGSRALRTIFRVDQRIAPRLSAFALGGREDNDSNDPAYVHRRTWVQAGLKAGL